jgi:hypothetical protein
MYYAIVQDVVGDTVVIGLKRIYMDLDAATADYKLCAVPWHQAAAEQKTPVDWVKHPPRLVRSDTSGMTQLFPTCDIASIVRHEHELCLAALKKIEADASVRSEELRELFQRQCEAIVMQ